MATSAAKTKTPVKPELTLTWTQAMAWRQHRHHLDRRVPVTRMLDVAAEIGGLQAQMMSSAVLALWARVDDLEPGTVERALWEERSLVKTWALRGTLHLLPATEYPVWQAALSTNRNHLKGAWIRYFGVTPEEVARMLAAITEALDGRMLTRDELADEVNRLTRSTELGAKLRESWGALLKPASFQGLICFAPSLGQNVRFTRPDQWLSIQSQEDPDTALLEFARRYLAAYGPATRDDLAHWWGMTPAAAGALIAKLGDDASPVEIECAPAWLLTEHLAEAANTSPSKIVRLLPAFDPYVIAASPHAASLLPSNFGARVYRPQGWLSPVLLVNGRLDGVWRHERKGARLLVQIEPFVAIPAWARKAAEGEAERLATFLGGNLELTWI